MAQGLILVLLGVAALSTTVASDLYLNYVRSYFQPFLVASGALLVLLGALSIAAEVRALRTGDAQAEDADHGPHGEDDHGEESHGHGHDHSRVPRVAWLLLLPVAAIFVVSPPALGAYTVSSTQSSVPDGDGESAGSLALPDDPDEPVELAVQEFVMHAWVDEDRSLAGQRVRLTGFAASAEEGEVGAEAENGWYLARLQMACCAADAIVNKVFVTNVPAPEDDEWVTVEGRWVEPEGELSEVRVHRFEVEELAEVDNPPDPYE